MPGFGLRDQDKGHRAILDVPLPDRGHVQTQIADGKPTGFGPPFSRFRDQDGKPLVLLLIVRSRKYPILSNGLKFSSREAIAN